MEIRDYSVIELVEKIKSRQLTSLEVVKYFEDRIEKSKSLNAVLEVFQHAEANAKIVDEKISRGEKVGKLAGVPIIIKDNILYKGNIASCASKFLENYKAEYTSTVVDRLVAEDAIILGRANMDEFAMGGSTEKSAYGPTHNAVDPEYVPGGSSGGSACAVAAGLAPCALGSDTGGSVRQPSSFNGVVGIKPTYGRVSRFGVVAFASSLDQVGPITKNVTDNALILSILAGQDINDETTLEEPTDDYVKCITGNIEGLRVGICREVYSMLKSTQHFDKIVNMLKQKGVDIVEVSIPDIELCLPAYYVLAPAEATSNLGRFDGIKYSKRYPEAKSVDEIYKKSRSAYFGKEVCRRIMLGNFVLSSGFYDAYYNKAKKLQQKVKKEFIGAFDECDILIMPVTYGEAYKIGAITDPVEMYYEDIFTISANISGIPALSVPCGKGPHNMPIGLQVCAKHLNEGAVYNFASFIEKNISNNMEKTNER